jgi:hypothetical protein
MSTIGDPSSTAARAKPDSNIDTPKLVDYQEPVGGSANVTAQESSEHKFEQIFGHGKKLEEILELLLWQLNSQQEQLALLHGLTRSGAIEEAPVAKLSPSLADYERAVKWMNNGHQDSVNLKELGKNFVEICGRLGGLWFPGKGRTSDVTPRHARKERLRMAWPESLGKLELNNTFEWDAQIRIDKWHIYNGEGEVPAWVNRPRLR